MKYNLKELLSLFSKGQLNKAKDACLKILKEEPSNFDILHLLGMINFKKNNYEECIKIFDKAIKIKPNYAQIFYNRGNVFLELKKYDDALKNYDEAIKIKPDYAEVYFNRGNTFKELNRLKEAIDSYNQAIKIMPNYIEAYNNLGNLFNEAKRTEEAIKCYKKIIKINSKFDFLLGTLIHTKTILADWEFITNDLKELKYQIINNHKSSPPFPVLSFYKSPELQKIVSEIWIKEKFSIKKYLKPIVKKKPNKKIRIGYYSADFYDHVMSYLLINLFELHDKSKFEIIGFSFGPEKKDEMRDSISATFNEFHDVRLKSDAEIVTLSRDLNIDIAIDLMGLTKYNRFGIFVERCAPIQINFLGYSSTIGSNCIDYIIGDETLIPKKFRNKYSEKVVYLPDSFMINDSTKKISDKNFTREELGLPKDGFVFCCFNNHYKITPDIFDIWMRILENIKDSVLWLSKGNQISQINLKKEADKRNISPDRIVFSERLSSLSDHLSRHKVADLFLDTLPYNAHSTCSDALWSGLPVLTCAGDSFAARVAASMLNAINLPELITNSKKEYEEKAINFANNPQYIKKIKKKLAENRLKAPLFNTDLYAKNIENIFHKIHLRHLNKLQPEHIEI